MYSETQKSSHYWARPVLATGARTNCELDSQNGWTRSYISELQNAEVGRKYAMVDRRPLDPPPVASFHIYDCDETTGVYRAPEEIHTLGYICYVDLYPCDGLEIFRRRRNVERRSRNDPPSNSSVPETYNFIPYSTHPTPAVNASSFKLFPYNTSTSQTLPGDPLDKTIHYIDGKPIRESSKLTKYLAGSTFVQPSIVYWEGKPQFMFVFSDLSVKIEGMFVLRYRVFDLFSGPNDGQTKVQCECFGRPFQVYSTKDFPGLQPSTELSKHISQYGVQINTREKVRPGKRKGQKQCLASPSIKRRRDENSSMG